MSHLVVPGQVIAVHRPKEDDEASSFLRGHGTYVDRVGAEERLVAAVVGTVNRVNKLISVQSVSETIYNGQVGDLVVGRITAVSSSRWKVQLTSSGLPAGLALSGVHLPGGVQRVRTAQDAREMRTFLQEGDLVSAEVHKVNPGDGSLQLHTRSFRYGKLENGCLVVVPPGRIPRRKNHHITVLDNQFQVLLGCNGMIWMQRAMPGDDDQTSNNASGDNNKNAGAPPLGPDLAELQEARQAQHVATPYALEQRRNLARLRNAVECLRLAHAQVTKEAMEDVYRASLELSPSQMLQPEHVLQLTESCRGAM